MQSDRDALSEAQTLSEVAAALSAELDLQKLVQLVTDAATRLTGAKFGAFFYNVIDAAGESYVLYTLSGAPREAFEKFGLPRNTPVFDPTFRGVGIVRSADITQDPRYGTMAPHRGMPNGHLPVRSYLAVPVVSRSGEVLGGLFFGHSDTGVFEERAERYALGIAAQAAISIDNANLFAKAEHELAQRRKTEDLLRQSEQRFRDMIAALPAAIYTTDLEGRITHYNAAVVELTGKEPGAGDRWIVNHKLYYPDGRLVEPSVSPMAKAIATGTPLRNFEMLGERPDGSRYWFTPFPTPLRDGEGRVTGGINMLVAITARKKAEEAVHQSEEKFRGVFESSAMGVAIVTLDGHFREVNRALCEISGYTEQELIGRHCADLIHAEDRPPMDEMLRQLVSNDVPIVGIEKRHVTKAGRTIWVRNSISVMRDPAGHPEYLIAICEDVTHRKQTERAMLLLGAIVDSSDDAIISKDLNSIVTSWNRGAERLFGYTADEAIGRSIIELLIPPERHEEENLILERLSRGERIDHFETVRRRKDGTQIDISLTISPIRDEQGNIAGASKIARDITERKRAEALLRASEERFRQLADAMPQMIWTARPDGFSDYYNARWYEFTGLTTEDLGDRFIAVLHPEDVERALATWYRAVETGETYSIEYRLFDRHEKRWRWFMGRALPIQNSAGQIVKWIGTCTDIDDQKKTEADLRSANRDLEQFAFSASHDLQEPLRTIKIYAELLGEHSGLSLEGDSAQYLRYVRSAAARMEGLLRDLLAYTQVARLEEPQQEVEAADALDVALANLAAAIEESGAAIRRGALPAVRVHPIHLQQLFQNLVGNAIKYRRGDRSPVVSIGALRQPSDWVFSVADNGIGIDPQYREQIFGLFTRLHNSDRYPGTGIGLALCQRIVERYRGRIWVESEPGNGSTFFFSIPV